MSKKRKSKDAAGISTGTWVLIGVGAVAVWMVAKATGEAIGTAVSHSTPSH